MTKKKMYLIIYFVVLVLIGILSYFIACGCMAPE